VEEGVFVRGALPKAGGRVKSWMAGGLARKKKNAGTPKAVSWEGGDALEGSKKNVPGEESVPKVESRAC